MGIFTPTADCTVISVSGGRTSAYILKRVLDENGGTLPENTLAIFQNTGKEKAATYDFLRDIEKNWNVDIIWLEYAGKIDKYKVVDYDTANREGKPFERQIEDNSMYLPNNVQRSCSMTMKNKTMSWYLADQGYLDVENWIGIRADEPKRFAMEGITYEKDKNGEIKYYKRTGEPKRVNKIINEEKYLPLRHAGVTKSEILNFWKNNDFDLDLGPNESNCDLCFMKGVDNLISEIKRNPASVDWWIRMEDKVSAARGPSTFRSDRPSYSDLKVIATDQRDMFFDDLDNLPCSCTN